MLNDDDRVILGGILTEVNQKVTRNNSLMAFLKLEDLTGLIEVIVFPKTLDKVRNLISTDAMVVVKGRVSLKEDEPPKLICETIEPLDKIDSSKLYIRVDNIQKAKEMKQSLMKLTAKHQGITPIYVFTANDRKSYRMPREMWVDLNTDILELLRAEFGEENIKVVD